MHYMKGSVLAIIQSLCIQPVANMDNTSTDTKCKNEHNRTPHLHQTWLFARTHVLRPYEEFWTFPIITRLTPYALSVSSELASTFIQNQNCDKQHISHWTTPFGNDIIPRQRIADLIFYCIQSIPIVRKFLLVRNELGVFSTYTHDQCSNWLNHRVRVSKNFDSLEEYCDKDKPLSICDYTHTAKDGILCWALDDATQVSQVAQAQCIRKMFRVPPGEFANHFANTPMGDAEVLSIQNVGDTPSSRRSVRQNRSFNNPKSPFVFFIQHLCVLALIVSTHQQDYNTTIYQDNDTEMRNSSTICDKGNLNITRATIVLKSRNDDISPNVDMLRKMCAVVSTLKSPHEEYENYKHIQISILFVSKHAPKNTNMVGIRKEYPNITLRWWPSSFFETDWFSSCNNSPMAVIRAGPMPNQRFNDLVGTCGHPLYENGEHTQNDTHDTTRVTQVGVFEKEDCSDTVFTKSNNITSMCRTCEQNLSRALCFQRSKTGSAQSTRDISHLQTTNIEDIVVKIFDLRVGDLVVHQRGKFKSIRQIITSPGEDDCNDIAVQLSNTDVAGDE